MFDYTARVRYHHTDRMGYVYYANYLAFFEEARVEMLRTWGVSYRKLEEDGIIFPVSEAGVKYLVPLHFDDLFSVRCVVAEIERVRFRVEYAVHRDDGRLTTTGFTVHPVINRNGRPVRLPENLRFLFLQNGGQI